MFLFGFQDAPSVGHLASKVAENKINLIFAVSGAQFQYQDLIEHIDGATYGRLSKDSDNIVDLITENYKVLVICVYHRF